MKTAHPIHLLAAALAGSCLLAAPSAEAGCTNVNADADELALYCTWSPDYGCAPGSFIFTASATCEGKTPDPAQSVSISATYTLPGGASGCASNSGVNQVTLSLSGVGPGPVNATFSGAGESYLATVYSLKVDIVQEREDYCIHGGSDTLELTEEKDSYLGPGTAYWSWGAKPKTPGRSYSFSETTPCSVTVRAEAEILPITCFDTCEVNIVKVDLDAEGVADDDEADAPGALVCVTNSPGQTATRNQITINKCEPASWGGHVALHWTAGNVKVYTEPYNGVEVTSGQTFANAALPATLWVEGTSPSGNPGDVVFCLNPVETTCPNAATGCDRLVMTILSVEFKENAPCAGFDPTLNPPWLMVPLPAGGNNKANAEITPAASAANIDFESAAVAKATVAPATASGSPEIVTVTSVAKGDTEVRAKVDAAECATMGISVKDKLTKTIVIHAITEDNDDVQAIPVGQGKPNEVAITAGANTTLDSTPGGDDQVAGTTITTGADGICNTTAASDDVQVIAVGKGKANQNCVTAGTNAKRDTKTSGDDTVVGENVTTGTDGICDTAANATDVPAASVPTAAGLQAYLNDTIWGKQANVFFTVTRTDHVLNFDLDLDGMLDDPYATPSGGNKVPQEWDEVNVVRGVKDGTKDFNIYYVGSYEYPIGLTVGDEVFTQGSSPGGNSVENHTAHEVGHLLGRSGESNAPKDVMYKSGLPSNPCRVLKLDWDAVNP